MNFRRYTNTIQLVCAICLYKRKKKHQQLFTLKSPSRTCWSKLKLTLKFKGIRIWAVRICMYIWRSVYSVTVSFQLDEIWDRNTSFKKKRYIIVVYYLQPSTRENTSRMSDASTAAIIHSDMKIKDSKYVSGSNPRGEHLVNVPSFFFFLFNDIRSRKNRRLPTINRFDFLGLYRNAYALQ